MKRRFCPLTVDNVFYPQFFFWKHLMFHFFAAPFSFISLFPGFRRFFLVWARKKFIFLSLFPRRRSSPKSRSGFCRNSAFRAQGKKMENIFQKSIDILRNSRYNHFRSKWPEQKMKIAPIAQLDRAFDYESKGHRFESCWVHHEKPLTSFAPLRVFLLCFSIYCWIFPDWFIEYRR